MIKTAQPLKMKVLAAAMVAVFLCLVPGTAHALCETGSDLETDLEDYIDDVRETLDQFITEMGAFVKYDLTRTASEEVLARLNEYDTNLYPELNDFWNDGTTGPAATSTLPALREMTKQISIAKVDQTRQIGAFIDAMLLNERLREKRAAKIGAKKKYAISDASCQVDSVNKSYEQTRAYRMSRALARAFAAADTRRRNNYLKPDAEPQVADAGGLTRAAYAGIRDIPGGGVPEDMKMTWDEYQQQFCDRTMGDQGCVAAPTPIAGKHVDIPGFLTGDTQTVDITVPENRVAMEGALRTLISPFVPPPIPRKVLDTPQGKEMLMKRRGRDARLNTVYNVMGQMIAERAGGVDNSVSVQELRESSGLTGDAASPAPSAKEMSDALGRARSLNAETLVRTVQEPEGLARELTAINAAKSQSVSDLHKRMEEMVLMEAAVYGHELDEKASNSKSLDAIFASVPRPNPAPPGPYGSRSGSSGGMGPGPTPAPAPIVPAVGDPHGLPFISAIRRDWSFDQCSAQRHSIPSPGSGPISGGGAAVPWPYTGMTFSDQGMAFVIAAEGVRRDMYLDSSKPGRPTIGIGHLIRSNETFNPPLSDAEITALFRQDLEHSLNILRRDIRVPLNQNQFDALLDFAHNAGPGYFSNFGRILATGDYLGAGHSFLEYMKPIEGRCSRRLIRRILQREMFIWGTYGTFPNIPR